MNANLAGVLCVVFSLLFPSLLPAQSTAGSLVALRHKSRFRALVLAQEQDANLPSSGGSVKTSRKSIGDDCLSLEPKALELVKEAWAKSGLKKERELSLENRLRISGWFPKLSGGLSYNLGDKWDYKYEPGEPRVDQLHQNNGLSWDVGMTIDLARAVYQVEQLAVLRESSRRAGERRDLALEVIRLVFARRQLMLHGIPEPGSSERSQLEEFTAVLDAWTGGVFQDRWCTKGVPL